MHTVNTAHHSASAACIACLHPWVAGKKPKEQKAVKVKNLAKPRLRHSDILTPDLVHEKGRCLIHGGQGDVP